jgi:hypothetical protein
MFRPITKRFIHTPFKKQTTISYEDISVFYTKNTRATNDKNNNVRESIIYCILNGLVYDQWYTLSEEWNNLKEGLYNFVKDLTEKDYEYISCQYYAGRIYNYDFIVKFHNDKDEIIEEKKIEFKYNVSRMVDYPQFLSISEDKFTKKYKQTYAEYFYDNYIEKVCELFPIDKPVRENYLKNIYTIKYDSDIYFKTVYNVGKLKNAEITTIMRESIKTYLYDELKLDLKTVNSTFKQKENGKIYMLYKNGKFHKDYIHDNELTIKNIKKIKNNNTIILTNEADKEIHMLLRWKNHKCCLLPSWQVKLTR